jgi:hypothetical protein
MHSSQLEQANTSGLGFPGNKGLHIIPVMILLFDHTIDIYPSRTCHAASMARSSNTTADRDKKIPAASSKSRLPFFFGLTNC